MGLFNTLQLISTHPLNRSARGAALTRFIQWQLSSRLAPGPVMIPWVGGTSLLTRAGDQGLTQNLYCGLQEFEEMAFVLHLLRPQDWFMDVGANAGAYSVLAGGSCGASGVAVEPVPDTFARLSMQLRVNGLEGRVKTVNAGCSDREGHMWFSTARDCLNSVVDENFPGPKLSLPISTVDILAGEQTPRWMKIDVEGHDQWVLRGAKTVLARPELWALVIEVTRSGATTEILAEQGFIPCDYDPFGRRLTQGNWADVKDGNVIAVRDFDGVSRRLAEAKPFEVLGKRI